MIKKGKQKVCKRCEYNKECNHINKPILCCIQIDRNPKKYRIGEQKK